MKNSSKMKNSKIAVRFLGLMAAAMLYGCTERIARENVSTIVIRTPEGTKGVITDEDKIWDINLFIFDAYGTPAYRRFTRYSSGISTDVEFTPRLIYGEGYEIFCVANAGFDMGEMDIEKLQGWRLYLRVPEGNIRGMPMGGHWNVWPERGHEIPTLELERLMSKVSIEFDASGLNSDVKMELMGAEVGNCPRSVSVFSESSANGADDIFSQGYRCEYGGRIQLYLCENIGGKSVDEDCSSYISLEFMYSSPKYQSQFEGLIYRFYIRDEDRYAAVRNCHYHYKIQPKGDGLGSKDGWRVDKSRLIER